MTDENYSIKEMLNRIEQGVSSLNVKVDGLSTELGKATTRVAVLEERADTNEDEIAKLRETSKTWNLLNSVGAALAGIIATMFR
jgi:chromosome segregation ATPase